MESLRCALYAALVLILFTELLTAPAAVAQVPGPNVNMVSGTQWPTGDPFLQRQNEPSMAVSTRNPMHILAGANDYRTVDLELVLSGGAETGDSWLGLFKSFDGGLTWTSTLLPGCPESVPQCVDNGALGGRYQAASDPVVRAGTNGMFYYAGLAFDRATGPTTASSVSSVFVARFADLNNNENLDTITYIDTHVLVSGNSSQFLDKPALAVDIPRSGATTCSFTANEPGAGANGGTLAVPQSFPAGNVYLTYTDFLAPTKSNATPTHLMFTRSTDCGVTWSTPIQINTGTTTSQGSAIAVNPWNGNVYVAWRQFSSSGVPDAIMVAESTNAGKTFNAPVQISTFQPFDQGTTLTSFRTNAYPSITTDMFGFVYVAFSARGLTASGDARVVVAGSIDGTHWTPPIMVDNPPQNAQNPSGRGHQIMPVITFANGRLTLLYYDLRLDHYAGFYTPSSTSPTGYLETLNPEGELAPPTPMPSEVFTKYIDDAGLTLHRHTLDLRVLELGLFPTVTLGPSVLVSQYAYGCCVNPNLPDIEQYKFNVPNLPLFAQGQDAFFGDYIDVVPSPLFLPKGNSWIYNFTPSVNPLFHAVWTDNRDVVPPANGNWADYTPPVPAGTGSVFQPGSTVPTCQVGQEGMRNQNIYTSQITGGLVVGAPGNAKPLGTTTFNGQTVQFQRAFAVEAQNVTGQTLYVRLSIANQPTGGTASFLQFSLLTTLDVTIPPYSSISRSVFVTSTNPEASITVNVAQISGIGGTVVTNGLNASTVLNPDITNPNITNPNITNPNITNPNITNFEITNPNITNPNITNPNVTNPNITNPNITNPNITNPNITNPNITNVSATNPNITNTTITNPNITNPNITNPNITNPDITNGSIQDVNYGITNNGNTTSSYTVKLVSSSTPPNGIVLQLILNRLYQTPVAANCQLGVETHWVTVANIISPKLFSASDPNLGNPDITNATPNEATVTLIPGETAYITLRVVNPTPALTPFNPVTAIAPVTVPQAVNTQTVLANPGNTSLTPPVTYPTLSILSPATLPATDQGDPGVYSYQLQSTGGAPGTLTWSIIEGALPSGMSLSPSGLITGQTTALGPNSVTIQVADSASPPNKTSKTFSIPVNPVFLKNVVGIINDGVVGQAYVAVPFTTTGGTAPITWTATGLPPGLSINASTGQISGTPTTANPAGYSVQVTATDSALPPSVVSATITIRVGAVIQITPATLPAGTIGVAYNVQLSATGGIGAYVFGPPAPVQNVISLSSSGLLTIADPQSSSLSFSVTVHDSANPNQVQTANYTITFGIPLQFTSSTMPIAGVGRFYSQPLPIAGGTPPYIVTQTGGTLPPGLSLSSNGVLAGTPSAAGSFTFTVQATDSSATPQSKTQTLTIASNTLFITTTALPNGIVGVPYNAPIATAGGTLPVSFSLANTAFPPGLLIQQPSQVPPSSTGALAGTPTLAGTYTFSETVADHSSPTQFATQSYVVTIAPAGTPAPATVTFVSQPQNSVGGQTLSSPVVVSVADATGAPISGASVAMSFNGAPPCPVATLTGTLTATTNASGQATFTNLSIDRGGFNYALLASTGSASAGSAPFHLQGFCASGNLSTQRELHTQDLLGTAQSIVKFPVDPKGAYVFTNTNPAPPGLPDIPDAPLIISLASLGIKPGDVISGVSVGDMNFCSVGSFCFGEFFNVELCGVFSSSNTLLPTGGTINRIPGAIPPDFTTAFPCNTPPTLFGGLPTDIQQDFSFFGEPVTVPNGAAYLFVAVVDSFYSDNSDPNGDLGIAITTNSPSVNGKVLIAGGVDNLGNALNTAELYDPASGTTSPTGNLTEPNGRAYHASVVLPNGKVLLIGGLSNVSVLASAELYDPTSGTFTATGSMSEPRFFAVAALLADGRVLVTGGLNTNVATNRAEIYDPSTGLFTPIGNMNQARARHTMTLLPNGKVLVTGGRDAQVRFEGTASAEIFDPFANQGVGAFTLIGNMNSPRFVHTATLLPNGTVLIAGGFNDGNESLSVTSAETFDYRTNVFTPTGSMSIPRARQTSTLLPDGTVLEVGGINSVQGVSAPAPAEVYSPTTGSFALTGAMITGRELPRATLLFNGNAVVSGGDDGVNVLASTEVYYNPVVKEPIVITTTSVPNGFISQPYVQLLLEQNTSGPVTWSLASGTLPPGISLSPSGILSGTPTATGSFIFTVQVTDGISAAPASFTINVLLATLTFTSNTMPTAGFGRPYSQLLPVTGGTLPYMATLTAGSLPPGLTLSSAGVLSGTPASAGSFTFTVNVMDSSTPAQSATQTLTIAVNNLFITTTALPNGVVGVPYNAAISTDGGTLPLSFSLTTAAFPPGLTIQQPAANSHNGALSGTPTLAGHYSFSESVVDSSTPAQTATQYYTMDILAAGTAVPANLTFAVQPQNSIGGQILGGSPILVHVTDANNAPILGASVVISFNGAPPCSTAVLSGTLNAITGSNGNAVFPDLSIDQGQLGYTLLASAGSASAVSQPFTVNGFCPNGLNITTTSPLPNGSLGSAYSTMVTAAGGTPPYTWSLASGSTLPAGLALTSGSPSATISGTPTATGTFQFSLDVKDSSGTPAMASASFLLTITGSTTLNCPATVNLTLCGTYFYGLRGFNSSGGPVAFGGTFVADNAGHIVSGQQRTNDSVAGVTTTTFTGGSYVMDSSADGRGVLTLTSSSASVSIFRFVLESAANAGPGTVEEFDGTGILASGILFGPATPPVPQLPANALMGIALEGIDSSGNRTGLLGELQVGASGCNGASGSLASPAGEPVVSNTAGTVNAALTLSGSCTAADTNTGVGTAQLTISGGSPFTSSTLNFTYIVVGSGSTVEGALFLETDAIGAHQPMLSGLGTGTVPPTGGFNGSSFTCPCLLVSAGTTNGSATSGGTDASIVRLTTSGTGASGTVAAVIDENSAGTITLAGTWPYSAFTVDAAGLGTLTGTGSPTVHFIATGSSGNDFTFSTLDESAGVQVGSFRAQNATSIGTPGSPYIAGRDLGNLGITRSTQHILGVLTPSGAAAGTFTGALDVISSAGAFAGVSPSGSYTGIDSTTGRGTGTANLTNGSSAINIVIYVRRVRQFVILDVGSTNPYVIGTRLQ